MKHKGLLITCIVLLSLIVLLLGGLMVWLLTGHSLSIGPTVSVASTASEVIYDESFEKLTKIEIDSDCGDISFEENKDGKFRLTAYGDTKDLLTVTEKDGVLKLSYPARKRFFNLNAIKNNIVLSLPSDYAGSIRVASAYGDVSICALEKAEITADCDYGDIEIAAALHVNVSDDCGDVEIGSVSEAKVEVDYGDIRIGEISASCQLDNNCGDITVGKMVLTADSVLEDDLGSITVGSAPGVRVKAETDLGSLNIRQNDEKADITLTITNNCGDISVG